MPNKICLVERESMYALPIGEYRSWYSALVEDKSTEIEGILNSDQNELMLHGRFSYQEEPKLLSRTRNKKRPPFELTRPLCLAVAFNAHNTIDVLHRNGSDIMVKDVNGKYLMLVHSLKNTCPCITRKV